MYKIICQKSYAIENWTQTFCPDIRTRWVKDELDYMSVCLDYMSTVFETRSPISKSAMWKIILSENISLKAA